LAPRPCPSDNSGDNADRSGVISLEPPPVRNPFVSYVTPLKPGQKVRIVSTPRHFALVEFTKYYIVSVPDVGLPQSIEVTMAVDSDGVPDPLIYESIGK